MFFLLAFSVTGCGQGESGEAPLERPREPVAAPAEERGVDLTVVYDNNPYVEGLKTSWGFSCLVEGKEKTILFDTGGDGEILFRNLSRLGIDPGRIDAVVISHEHADHTAGLARLMQANPGLEVYLPASFSSSLKEAVRAHGHLLVEVTGPMRICEGVWTTGEVGSGIREQALVIEGGSGSLVVTGCAHPGVVEMVKAAVAVVAGDVALVLGGFHLGSSSEEEIGRIINALKALGVRRIGPCHCTGERAMRAFSEAYGDAFIQVGAGKRISAQELE
jgi:7,8-dihydropterin-6-yl-methyl-4-(beta-D-ribofuranosyl)aminobenzene 5'-phosphate synthase